MSNEDSSNRAAQEATSDTSRPRSRLGSAIRWLGFISALLFALAGIAYIRNDAQVAREVILLATLGGGVLVIQSALVLYGFFR